MRRQCYKRHRTTPSGGAARFGFTGWRSDWTFGFLPAANKPIHLFILERVLSFKMTGIVGVSYQLPLQSCPRQCHPPSPLSQSWSPSPRYRFRSYSESEGRHITQERKSRKRRQGDLRATSAFARLSVPCTFSTVSQHLIPAAKTSSCDLKEQKSKRVGSGEEGEEEEQGECVDVRLLLTTRR